MDRGTPEPGPDSPRWESPWSDRERVRVRTRTHPRVFAGNLTAAAGRPMPPATPRAARAAAARRWSSVLQVMRVMRAEEPAASAGRAGRCDRDRGGPGRARGGLLHGLKIAVVEETGFWARFCHSPPDFIDRSFLWVACTIPLDMPSGTLCSPSFRRRLVKNGDHPPDRQR